MFKKAHLYTTGGTEMESNTLVEQVSTIIRLLISKDSGLSSYYDETNETFVNDISLKEIPIDGHTTQANKGKTSGQLPLEHNFRILLIRSFVRLF